MLGSQFAQQSLQVADILAIAMRIEHHGPRLGMVEIPTVQTRAVGGREMNVFKL